MNPQIEKTKRENLASSYWLQEKTNHTPKLKGTQRKGKNIINKTGRNIKTLKVKIREHRICWDVAPALRLSVTNTPRYV